MKKTTNKKPLMLVVSARMDKNKKEDRNEHQLIRMSSVARNNMGFNSEVELFQDGSASKRINQTALLNVFQAYKDDVSHVKAMVKSGEIAADDLNRIGFVTTKTYKRLTGQNPTKKPNKLWVSDCVEDIVLGADPEFILCHPDDGQFIHAGQINGMGKLTPLGADGAMAELRPSPSIRPEGVSDNIRSILADNAQTDKISTLDWIAGCYFKDKNRAYSIGGHIHIGNPAQIAKIPLEARTKFFKGMNKIIDELLALPMIRLDGKKGSVRRMTGSMGSRYGYFGEMRICCGRLEHRTLSGMWLAHPEIATAVFGTAKAIVDEIYRHVADNKFDRKYMIINGYSGDDLYKDSFKAWDKLPLAKDLKCTTDSATMRKILNESDPSVINGKFIKQWYARMKAMTTYSDYKHYIDRLYSILISPRKRLDTISGNLKDNWLVGRDLNVG